MKKWSFVALLLIGATILGATVLREPIASAAQGVSANITSPLDANGNVAVHEKGTANVNVTNDPVHVSGTVNVNGTTRRLLATPPDGLFLPPQHPNVPLGTIGTASLSQVRIAADGRDCTDGASLHVALTDAAGPSRELLDADLNFGTSGPAVVSRLFDVPGTELSVSVANNSQEFGCTVDVTVWGH